MRIYPLSEVARTYSPTEVAEIEGVDPQTVLHWIRTGQLKAHCASKLAASKKPRWRITDADLTAFRLSRQNGTKEPTQPRRKRAAGPIKEYV